MLENINILFCNFGKLILYVCAHMCARVRVGEGVEENVIKCRGKHVRH